MWVCHTWCLWQLSSEQAGLIREGEGVLKISFKGQEVIGNLTKEGTIEYDGQRCPFCCPPKMFAHFLRARCSFATPSAWSISVKRAINPEKR